MLVLYAITLKKHMIQINQKMVIGNFDYMRPYYSRILMHEFNDDQVMKNACANQYQM